MVNCSAYGCKSRSEKKEPGISFHGFPKDLEKRKMWISNMKLDVWEPSKNSRLCSKHFEECYFYKSDTHSRVRLLNGTVPTIFPELPKYLQPTKDTKSVGVQVDIETRTVETFTDNKEEDKGYHKKTLTEIFDRLKTELVDLHSHIEKQNIKC